MNNLPPRFIFSAIGVLVVIIFVINHWLSKELVAPAKPVPVFVAEEEPPAPIKVEQKDYDPHSDYAPVPSGEGLQQEVFGVKKPERITSEKIIYEMPTSNKYLLE
ncbi:MAG: hypothetical protein IT395_00220 [Candidatus Omnitrophica bacterium]|nr:hypothetical protein [Candidatus Omnitrophota bacterium]